MFILMISRSTVKSLHLRCNFHCPVTVKFFHLVNFSVTSGPKAVILGTCINLSLFLEYSHPCLTLTYNYGGVTLSFCV